MKKGLKILGILVKTVFALIVVLAVLTLVTSRTDFLSGIRSFVVVSGSMQPSIKVGSIVFVKKAPQYELGDIVAFTNNANQTVTHRIIAVNEKSDGIFYQLKGDANNTPDREEVLAKSIIGRELLTVPLVGKFSARLRSPPGFLGLIILPALIFIILELRNIKIELEKEIEKKVLRKIGQR